MSEERNKLHWITALIEVLKTLKEMILPLIVIVFANGLQDSGTGKWYWDYLTFIIFGVLIIVFFITGIIKWKRFVYWFEDDELRIEYGLFVKKKRYIPFHRIQSLDYTEGILHRPLKLVKVKVETAGGADIMKSDAELTAITKEAAKRIEEKMAEAKQNIVHKPDDIEGLEAVVEPRPKLKLVYKMTSKDLLVLATTSGGIGLILSGVLIFLVQFAEFIPFDKMYIEISEFIKYGLLIVAIAVFLVLLVIWGISVLMTYLGYYGFTVELDKEDLVISRGLIEKKRVTVPLNRVQSVRIIENPFRQLFGYANVVIDNAGGGLGDSARINLFPLLKKSAINGPLKEIFPDLIVDEPTRKVPDRGKRYYYRIDFLWMIPAIVALTYYFYPYGLFSIAIIPIIVLWGLFQHRSAAFEMFGNQLTMRFRGISLQTAYMMKNRIQSMEMKQNYFHRKKNVAVVSARVKSGVGVFNAQVSYMEEEDANQILDWYEPVRVQGIETDVIVENNLD
ncbi:PH domain-containing protein [Sporosarcina sp. 6E9]|uniref:PH domain-containing protein n=1 Tax=Sporosarcina sp. 6E9 TaxID=2819235 RepID=UPI001FF0A617|nr:PH domain-containing protein [Sporosarcina sp. 6E9]